MQSDCEAAAAKAQFVTERRRLPSTSLRGYSRTRDLGTQIPGSEIQTHYQREREKRKEKREKRKEKRAHAFEQGAHVIGGKAR